MWNDNHTVYGVDKVWQQLGREKLDVARTVERLMHEMGLQAWFVAGPSRSRAWPTRRRSARRTWSIASSRRRGRTSSGLPTSRTWRRGLASSTSPLSSTCSRGASWAGACRARSRPTLRSMRSTRAPRAAGCERSRSPQRPRTQAACTSILHEATHRGQRRPVGSVGDSYDNDLAETINDLYKAEVIHRRGPLLEPLGYVPPAEFERRTISNRVGRWPPDSRTSASAKTGAVDSATC